MVREGSLTLTGELRAEGARRAQHRAGMSPFMYLPLLPTVFLGEPWAMGDGSSAAPSLNLLPATTSPVQPWAC